MDTWVRWAGGCWIAAGVLMLAELAHPDALAIGFAASSRQTLWPALHVAWVLAAILTVFGLWGLFARHGAALGRLGVAGAVIAVPGLVVTAGLFLTEAFVFPVLAREDPALLDLDGDPQEDQTDEPQPRKSCDQPQRHGPEELAVATVLFAALEGPFLPIAGDLAVLAFSAAHVWLGRSLLVAGLPYRVSGEGSDRTTTREGTAR